MNVKHSKYVEQKQKSSHYLYNLKLLPVPFSLSIRAKCEQEAEWAAIHNNHYVSHHSLFWVITVWQDIILHHHLGQ